ncbi:RNA polymerase sigma factor [Nakamurella endophytica]|uniref:RNA polymerase sigma-70 region 2 domain-containing protein n=1 Tax=Nakamurella endophytica TaxID=1748367 RepID=A0A917SNI3_9ACTN|nr:sigma-70 family RNA polymerase sigma factor [Nakamurella endophytica]GGL91232.1 hypothetical protein GCM10011594_08650 [Nakamurella endophytica]
MTVPPTLDPAGPAAAPGPAGETDRPGAAGPAPTDASGQPGSDHARSATGTPVPAQRRSGDVGDLVVQAAAAFTDYRNGVAGGIDRLVRLVSPLLWHTARQCGLSPAEAEDSVQQAFVALVRRGATISDPLAVVRWLTVTLRRQAWRDRAVSAQRTAAEPTDLDLPREPSAEASAVLTDEQRRLWEHVGQLSERCRQLLAVIAFAPRPDYAAIARSTGMPIGSIGPTRGRCLDKLRARLQGEEWR